jgi:hypothetical protein
LTPSLPGAFCRRRMCVSRRDFRIVLVAAALSVTVLAAVVSDSLDSLFREFEEETEGRRPGRSDPIDPLEWISQSVSVRGGVPPPTQLSMFLARRDPVPGRVRKPASLFGRLYDHSPPAAVNL